MDSIHQILNNDTDLYSFLQVTPSSSPSDIRRQYRKLALKHHPDKQGGNADQFNLLTKVYEILSDETLRAQYNEIRRIKQEKVVQRDRLEESTRKFRQELERAEKQHRFDNLQEDVSKRKWINDLEKLKEDGLKRRRLQETAVRPQESDRRYISFKEIPLEKQYASVLETSGSVPVKVTWKHKPELQELFNEDVLKQIMEIFGPIKSVSILPNQSTRYDYGIVEYERASDTSRALDHDYRKSASNWDGTNVRKLASLLRDCKSMSNEGLVDEIRRNLPSNFKLTSTNNVTVDEVLNRFLNK